MKSGDIGLFTALQRRELRGNPILKKMIHLKNQRKVWTSVYRSDSLAKISHKFLIGQLKT